MPGSKQYTHTVKNDPEQGEVFEPEVMYVWVLVIAIAVVFVGLWWKGRK